MKSDKKRSGGLFIRRGLFTKYLTIWIVFLLSTILVLGGILLVFSSDYIRRDKESQLQNIAMSGATLTQNNLEENSYLFLNPVLIGSGFDLLAETSGSNVFLVDPYGNTKMCSEGSSCIHTSYRIPDKILTKVFEDGFYTEVGRLDGIYSDERFITVGVPVMGPSGTAYCAVFVSASAAWLDRYTSDTMTIFGVTSLAVFIVSCIAMYFATKGITKPLVRMAAAAGQFSRGDFTMRINVKGDDEVAQLGRSFNEMATALSALENSRRSFVANVSHELKTPMTTIGGFIDGILDGTIPPEKHQHYLKIVSEEVGRLSRMVRAMLSLSRLDAGDMVIKPTEFDIRDILVQTVFSFEQKIDAKQLEIRGLDGPKCLVRADRDLLYQVVYNLIDNAVKFVNQDGYIAFDIQSGPDWTRVSIQNSGPGISRAELSSVFERFYKTDRSRGLDKSGVGLGLYIVKSVVQLHGGEINVHSTENEFTEFVFTIPTAHSKPSKHTVSPKEEAH